MSKRIVLNVDGIKYETTLATLSSISDIMLDRMFNGEMKSKHDEDGSYFIDHDGEIFKYILNFLRYRTIDVKGFNESIVSCINQALDYFQIPTKVTYSPIIYLSSNREKYLIIKSYSSVQSDDNLRLSCDGKSYFISFQLSPSEGSYRYPRSAIFFAYHIRFLNFSHSEGKSGNVQIVCPKIKFNDSNGRAERSKYMAINSLFVDYWED